MITQFLPDLMKGKSELTNKHMVVQPVNKSKKYWMTDREFTSIIIGKEATDSEYVISDGIMVPGGFVPEHFHKWEDQTFHVLEGELEAKIGDEYFKIEVGDTIQCPRGVTHFMKNIGSTNARLLSYIFPGDWAEEFFAETSRQTKLGKRDLNVIEEKFGVVYTSSENE